MPIRRQAALTFLYVEEDRRRHDDYHSNYRLVRGGRVGSSRSTLAPLRGSALDYVEKQRYRRGGSRYVSDLGHSGCLPGRWRAAAGFVSALMSRQRVIAMLGVLRAFVSDFFAWALLMFG